MNEFINLKIIRKIRTTILTFCKKKKNGAGKKKILTAVFWCCRRETSFKSCDKSGSNKGLCIYTNFENIIKIEDGNLKIKQKLKVKCENFKKMHQLQINKNTF